MKKRAVFLAMCGMIMLGNCTDPETENKTSDAVTYSITVTQSAGGDLTVKAGDGEADLYFAAAQAGTEITLSATANNGYAFDSFDVTGVTLDSVTANPQTFTMPANEVTVRAAFSKVGNYLQGTSKYNWGITAGQKVSLQAGSYTAGVRHKGNSTVFRFAANVRNTGGGESPWLDLLGGETKPMPASENWTETTGNFVLDAANDLYVFLITNPTDSVPMVIDRIWLYKNETAGNLLSNGNFADSGAIKIFANDAPGPNDFVQAGYWYVISDWQIVDPDDSGNTHNPKDNETPKMADSFVDSIGVCTHLSYYDTSYGDWDGLVFPMLVESGIRYIRDDLPTWPNWDGVINPNDLTGNLKHARLQKLKQNGISLNAVMQARYGYNAQGDKREFTQQQYVDMLLPCVSYVVSVEGPNEYNFPYATPDYNSDWANILRRILPLLYNGVKNTPQLAHLPVIGPSIVLDQGHGNDHNLLGNVSQWVDYGNIHNYPCENVPSVSIDQAMSDMNTCFGGKPYVVTETGNYTLINGWGLSERADGIHMPRLFLEFFNRGIKRSYKYQLLDHWPPEANPALVDDEENFYGLIDNKGNRKPSFYAIKNIIALLKDPGPDFTPKTINYTITGGNSSIHHTLLQKRDGRLYLCLWAEVKSFNDKVDVYPAAQNLTVTLNSVSASSVKVYKPSSSATVVQTLGAGKVINIGVNDEVVVLEITP